MRHSVLQKVPCVALTPERLAATYTMLRSFPPYNRWKLPPAEKVKFRVCRHDLLRGEFKTHGEGWYEIMVSSICVKHMNTLVATMAHEMIHLAAMIAKTDHHKNNHNADFHRRAKLVCARFGWDYGSF